MEIKNNKGEKIGELNTMVTKEGTVIMTNTIYDNATGRAVAQHISTSDAQGKVRTEDVIGGKILP